MFCCWSITELSTQHAVFCVCYLDIKLSVYLNITPRNIQFYLCPSIMPWIHLGGGCKDWHIVNHDANQLLKISLYPAYFKWIQTHQRHVYRFFRPQNVTGPTRLCVRWVPGTFYAQVKRLRCDADPSPPSSDEVRSEWNYASTVPLYLPGMYPDNCTFICPNDVNHWPG